MFIDAWGIPEWLYWMVIGALLALIAFLVWCNLHPKPKPHHKVGLTLRVPSGGKRKVKA